VGGRRLDGACGDHSFDGRIVKALFPQDLEREIANLRRESPVGGGAQGRRAQGRIVLSCPLLAVDRSAAASPPLTAPLP